ncbi:hypothetical protein SESBI_44597 [Sesbania bispinosa]|nr:hypothetical protein SESBI_44597 [Sesbania bispinosa]
MPRSRRFVKEKRFGRCFSVANSDQLAADASNKDSPANDQLAASMNPPSDETFQLQAKVNAESVLSQTSEGSNGSIDQKEGSATSPNSQGVTKRSSPALKERLRAARALSRSRYNKESTEPKPEMGSSVLEALKESEKGKKKSRLPEAPSNLFDDSNREKPKQGWTFQFPGGNDLLFIVFSVVFISTVMFTTTYIVWKVGAIHFNEY